MKATKSSRQFMNTIITKLTIVSGVPITAPSWHVMNMTQVSDNMIACPPIIFANRRTIRANGLVNIPKSSITGIIGTGHFNQVGTGGHRISIQYSLLPNTLTNNKVNIANTNVMFIFPVMFAPPGKIGRSPNRFVMKMKKNAVSKKGAYCL